MLGFTYITQPYATRESRIVSLVGLTGKVVYRTLSLSPHLVHHDVSLAGVYGGFQVCGAEKRFGQLCFSGIVSQNGL